MRIPLRQVAIRKTIRMLGGQEAARALGQLLTAQETAELLSLQVSTIRGMTHRKEIPYVKIGKRGVRYRLIDLLAWIEERTRMPRE